MVYHLDDNGLDAFVVVSKVVRRPDKFTARSHFRFGHRESFPHASVQIVFAPPSLDEVALSDFLNGKKRM